MKSHKCRDYSSICNCTIIVLTRLLEFFNSDVRNAINDKLYNTKIDEPFDNDGRTNLLAIGRFLYERRDYKTVLMLKRNSKM